MAIVNTKSNEASQIATGSYQIRKHRDFFGMMVGELESLGFTDIGDIQYFGERNLWDLQTLVISSILERRISGIYRHW